MIGLVVVLQLISLAPLINGAFFPALFNFGDSTSDSGGIHATFPNQIPAEFPLYGDTYPSKPTGKYSDGRLLVDFLCEAIGLSFLDSVIQLRHCRCHSPERGLLFSFSIVHPITAVPEILAGRDRPPQRPKNIENHGQKESKLGMDIVLLAEGGRPFCFSQLSYSSSTTSIKQC